MANPQTTPLYAPPSRDVVAIILTCRGKVGLFKRSQNVGFDGGRWQCITGYVDESSRTFSQAIIELREETGLEMREINSLVAGETLTLQDDCGATWRVHTFLATTSRRKLSLNWEHDHYRWVPYHRVSRFDGQVKWLKNVLAVFDEQMVHGELDNGRQVAQPQPT
ncbi:NUDIX domain-containing protein [bacterium RCC_150]